MSQRSKKTLKWLVALFLGWLGYLGFSIWTFEAAELPPRSDCVIVLGAAVNGMKPSPVFEERVRHAIELHQQGRATKIIFTGGQGEGTTYTEAHVGSTFAIRLGVNPASILRDEKSRTTQENLAEASKLMAKENLTTAIIVSDPLHLKRASAMARDLGIAARHSATPTSRYQSLQTRIPFLLREILFYQAYLLTGK